MTEFTVRYRITCGAVPEIVWYAEESKWNAHVMPKISPEFPTKHEAEMWVARYNRLERQAQSE